MYTKEQFLVSLEREITIIRHLAEKLNETELDYRPTANQRSIRELLQYLSFIFGTTSEILVNGDMSLYKTASEASMEVTLENFNERMTAQYQKVKEIVSAMTEAQLQEEVDLYGKQTRAGHLVNGLLKWAAAYKTQLFTYMKQNGHGSMNTMNLWVGVDGTM